MKAFIGAPRVRSAQETIEQGALLAESLSFCETYSLVTEEKKSAKQREPRTPGDRRVAQQTYEHLLARSWFGEHFSIIDRVCFMGVWTAIFLQWIQLAKDTTYTLRCDIKDRNSGESRTHKAVQSWSVIKQTRATTPADWRVAQQTYKHLLARSGFGKHFSIIDRSMLHGRMGC